MLPAFNHEGNLPEGIHVVTEDEVFERFATPPARRQWLGEQLRSLVALAKSTGQLARMFLWGSFVTSKEVPNDLDVLLVMGTEFAQYGSNRRRGDFSGILLNSPKIESSQGVTSWDTPYARSKPRANSVNL